MEILSRKPAEANINGTGCKDIKRIRRNGSATSRPKTKNNLFAPFKNSFELGDCTIIK